MTFAFIARASVLCALAGFAATAQDQVKPAPVLNAAVSGIVRDKGTGQPLADYTVSVQVNATWHGNTIVMKSSTKEVKSTTDESGHYRLGDLPPAAYRISARDSRNFSATVTRHVTL